jgi:hypothetical protein
MKPHRQRIAIAKACGFKWSEYSDELGQLVAEFTPDYLNDLNAMHEAEKVLTKNKSMEYAFRLADSWILNGEDKQPDLVRGFCATAAERAEAFLKTIGKWEDEA